MKNKSTTATVGKIVLEGRLQGREDEDHSNIFVLDDGMEFHKLRLSVDGLKALYHELGIHIREMESTRKPK